MSDIFISHAVADKRLAKALVNFLKEAIGVREESIFCSSIEGHDVPLGEDFNTYIKNEIQEPKLVILLMTETYMERPFCLMELGAAWAKSYRTLPMVVPDVSYESVTNTLGLKQAMKITDHKKLVQLRNTVKKTGIELEARQEETWEDKRDEWKKSLSKILKNLEPATRVEKEVFDAEVKKNAELNEKIASLSNDLANAEQKIKQLTKLKDQKQVVATLEQLDPTDYKGSFEKLLEAVSDARPKGITNKAFRYIILDRVGSPGLIDWSNDRAEFNDAVEYGLIDGDDDSVLWQKPKLRRLRGAIDSVRSFLENPDNSEFVGQQEEKEVPMDCADRDFWEHHLSN